MRITTCCVGLGLVGLTAWVYRVADAGAGTFVFVLSAATVLVLAGLDLAESVSAHQHGIKPEKKLGAAEAIAQTLHEMAEARRRAEERSDDAVES